MENKDINEIQAFQDSEENIYGKAIKPVPKPKKEIGIDTEGDFYENIIGAIEVNKFDTSAVEAFSNVSRNRNEMYNLIDTMGEDPVISRALEIYASEATETNDNGEIVWVESSDPAVSKYVKYLLDTMNVDKHIYQWAYSLGKYGDIYLRLYRQSEEDAYTDIFKKGKKESLNEAVKLNAFKENDKYTHYVEMVPNPAEMFELTKYGKSIGYIKTNVDGLQMKKDDVTGMQGLLQKFSFQQKDVDMYEATEFVHGVIDSGTTRFPEEVELFLNNDTEAGTTDSYTFSVRKGQSLLANTFKIWRMLSMLESSLMLNRLTKSSIVRILGIEVGDMDKADVKKHMLNIKNMIEQKASIDTGSSYGEYTNPGPIENNIYVPTRNGIGAITPQQIGGDVDVKGIADIDYFKNLLYSSLKVPKQYLGDTDDATGFNGGTSLSIVSSSFAKDVKFIQNALCQMLTDAIHLMLIDKGLENYVNKFTIRMLAPTTQEELDRRDNMSTRLSTIGDVGNLLSDIEDPIIKLKIKKSMLSGVLSNSEVISLIQEQIDKLEQQAESEPTNDEDLLDTEEDISSDEPLDLGSESSGETDTSFEETTPESGEEETAETAEESGEAEETILPSPSELGVGDMSDSTNPELQ